MGDKVVCWDLDSTLRSSLQRHHLSPAVTRAGGEGPQVLTLEDWHAYGVAGISDAPQPGPIAMMKMAWRSGAENHVVSGSTETARPQSEAWLNEHAPYYQVLRLRTKAEEGTDSGLLKAQYVLGCQALGMEVLAFWEDWAPAAKTITELTGVPCVVVNPVYPDMCTCGYAGKEVSQ